MVDEPRFVDHGQVTADTLANSGARVLEINSKTSLYPLYVTYSIFRSRCDAYQEEELDSARLQPLWDETVRENVFVICKTPMAKQITRRTLAGYRDIPVNAHYFDDLINMMKNKPRQFVDRVLKPSYWKLEGVKTMKFDAVVGNPPYQVMDGGSKASATPVYNYFVEQAKELKPAYVSVIIPARWYSGGRGLDSFRESMLHAHRIRQLFDYSDSNDCFAGGICYFLWDENHDGSCEVVNFHNGSKYETLRQLDDNKVFVRYGQALSILNKVQQKTAEFYDSKVSSQKPFGLRTYVVPTEDGDIQLRHTKELAHSNEIW